MRSVRPAPCRREAAEQIEQEIKAGSTVEQACRTVRFRNGNATPADLTALLAEEQAAARPCLDLIATLHLALGQPAPPTLKTYTAFCQDLHDTGTIWIDSVEPASVEDAKHKAVEACADERDFSIGHVHYLGLVDGDVKVAHWEELGC